MDLATVAFRAKDEGIEIVDLDAEMIMLKVFIVDHDATKDVHKLQHAQLLFPLLHQPLADIRTDSNA